MSLLDEAEKQTAADHATVEINTLKIEMRELRTELQMRLGEMQQMISTLADVAVRKQETRVSPKPFIQPSLPQQPTQPNIMQTPLNQPDNAFTAIKNFAEAMGALRNYENTVIGGYRQLRSELREEVSTEDFEDAPQSGEDMILKIAAEQLLKGGQTKQQSPSSSSEAAGRPGTEGYTVVSGEAPYQAQQPQQPQQPAQPENFDYKQAAAQVPEYIKKGIRSGEIDLKQATEIALKEAEKMKVPVSKENIEKLYTEIKNTKK